MLSGAERFAKRIVLRSRSTPILTSTLHPGIPFACEIEPLRIDGFNESNLLGSSPTLELLLTTDSSMHNIEGFPVKQTLNVVFVGESLQAMELVLESSCMEFAGHTDVERPG